MIRRVAFTKAILAGAVGAAVWEGVARIAASIGLPVFDLVRTLGTLVLGDVPAPIWWSTGMLLHAGVGAMWAILYAYFFWSSF